MTQIIAVHSFRGGTGKSNSLANIAASLALEGRRVGILDTDIQSPGIHIIFGLQPAEIKFTLNDYLWGRCGMKDAAYDLTASLQQEAGGTKIKGSLFLVPASIKANEISRILREGYDVMHLNHGLQEMIRSLKLDYLLDLLRKSEIDRQNLYLSVYSTNLLLLVNNP